jgi:hypothetical protein
VATSRKDRFMDGLLVQGAPRPAARFPDRGDSGRLTRAVAVAGGRPPHVGSCLPHSTPRATNDVQSAELSQHHGCYRFVSFPPDASAREMIGSRVSVTGHSCKNDAALVSCRYPVRATAGKAASFADQRRCSPDPPHAEHAIDRWRRKKTLISQESEKAGERGDRARRSLDAFARTGAGGVAIPHTCPTRKRGTRCRWPLAWRRVCGAQLNAPLM